MKLNKFKKKLSNLFKKENFTEIIDYFGYILIFGVPAGITLLAFGISSGLLIGLGIGSLLWLLEYKIIKLLRQLWFR